MSRRKISNELWVALEPLITAEKPVDQGEKIERTSAAEVLRIDDVLRAQLS